MVPAGTPTGIVGVKITAKDKAGRMAEVHAVPERRRKAHDRQRVIVARTVKVRAAEKVERGGLPGPPFYFRCRFRKSN